MLLLLNEILMSPKLRLPVEPATECTADVVFTAVYKDGSSVEKLALKVASVAFLRTLAQWPGITTMFLTAERLQGLLLSLSIIHMTNCCMHSEGMYVSHIFYIIIYLLVFHLMYDNE